jgi:hypothetical protein
MTRFLVTAATAIVMALAAPSALAADCHGDCANCPHRAAGAAKDAAAPAGCACDKAKGGRCTCKPGCKCEHCAQGKPAPEKAPSKS